MGPSATDLLHTTGGGEEGGYLHYQASTWSRERERERERGGGGDGTTLRLSRETLLTVA